MTKAKADIEVSVELGLTVGQVARSFQLSPNKFAELVPSLEAEGFPKPHPLMGRYILEELKAWCRKRARRNVLVAGPESTHAATLAPNRVSNLIAERAKRGAS